MPKDKNGVVGANKNADRQIIVWITHEILQAIPPTTNTDDLSNLKIYSSEPIQGYSMKNACEVWGNVPLSVICERFKKAYNSKLFSKSKKYVLPYFVAVKNILSNKKTDELPALLDAFAKSCKEISNSDISNKKALFSATEIKGNGTSTFKTAMDKLIGEYEELKKKLQLEEDRRKNAQQLEEDRRKNAQQLEEDRRKNAQKFEILAQGLLDDLERYYSWEVFDDLKDRLDKLVKCFETAYLSGGKLTVKHPTYTLEPKTGSYLLTAYPVLHALSKKATTDNITDNTVKKINTFVEGAYTLLDKECELMYQPEYGAPPDFDKDIGAVLFVL